MKQESRFKANGEIKSYAPIYDDEIVSYTVTFYDAICYQPRGSTEVFTRQGQTTKDVIWEKPTLAFFVNFFENILNKFANFISNNDPHLKGIDNTGMADHYSFHLLARKGTYGGTEENSNIFSPDKWFSSVYRNRKDVDVEKDEVDDIKWMD